MSAPESFTLELIPQGANLPPSPPLYVKGDIYTDLKVFKAIDGHAIKESQKRYSSFRDLIWNLCYRTKFSELERARIIFRWLTCADLTKVSFPGEKNGSPEQLLSAFKTGKATYARIFECLARHSGLSCFTICGWAKGVDYRPGVALTNQPINHSWNGIYIDGNWQLIDCHWATRFLQSEQNIPENLVYEYDDFYFVAEPEQLSYTHYPEDSAWLLLETPLTKEKFEQYPLVKSYFFTTGMYLLPDCSRGVISTRHGITNVSLGLTNQTAFTFKLGYGDSLSEKVGDVELSSYAVQETKDDQVVYYLRLPQKGDYYLIVFANLVPDDPDTAEGMYKAICEYKVVCDEPAKADPVAFPSCSDVSWGPDAFVTQYGLTPKNREAILMAPNGHVEVPFDKRGDVRVYARLVRPGVDDAELKQALAVKTDDDKVTILVDLPEEGEYGLEIFANDPNQDGDMFTHVCQYLCSYTKDPPLITYGKVPDVVKRISRRPIDPSLEDRALYKPSYDSVDAIGGSGSPSLYMTADYPFGQSPSKKASSDKILPTRVAEPEQEYKPHSSEVYTSEIDVKPPEHFEAVKLADMDAAPEPEVAKAPSEKLFKDTNVFKDIDTHAVEVSKKDHGSFRDILWHLIFARDITNELDRARAIFLWLCSKDLNELNFTDYEKLSPEENLMNLKNGQTTYARVYETLCSYANLHCKTLTGYAKGAEYKPGNQFVGQQGQHSWNAVLIKGIWQLVDCHWAARRLVGKKLTSDNVRYELDEYYFMPAPTQLIYSHFPENATWQLLEKPLTLAEFEELVPVKPTFFKYGLELLSHTNAIIHCNNDVSIRIDCPPEKVKSMRFTFNVTYDDGREEYEGIKLNRYGMQEVAGHVCFVNFRPPEKASYQLVIYAKDLDNQAKEGIYGGICEYKIICDEVSGKPAFPPCVHTTWGAGDSAPKFDLVPLNVGSIAVAKNGLAEVKFRLNTAVRLRFMAKLKSNDRDEKSLAPYVMYRTIGDTVVFRVSAPTEGEFGLEIYANNPELGGNTLQHVYQYLVIAKEVPDTVEPFPTLTTGFLGPQVSYSQLGLTTIDQVDPFIQTASGDLQVSFGTTQPLRVTSQLTYVSSSEPRDCSEYILQQGSQTGVTFIIKLTEKGMYKFQVFAAPQASTVDSLPGVFNYLIDCRGTLTNLAPFPKQFGPWKEGCYLYEPLDGHLQANRPSQGSASSYQHIYFSMEVPKAVNVAIIIGTEWTQLVQKSPGRWEAEVFMEKHWGKERKASVCANFNTAATSYSTLLEYSM